MKSMIVNKNPDLTRLINFGMLEFFSYMNKNTLHRESIKKTTSNPKGAGRKQKYMHDEPLLLRAFQAYTSGQLTETDIERELGINRQTFRRYRKKHGIERIDNKDKKTE